ncbi:hypothetical protein M9H77_22251 [Catharanthus roseus]|uniref:Uncharacterized protein n=1 Tax=Catharanthus roseus TaxID=4058 RepID=A0ACC0ASJ7_CATRO|nr:hypothetical protein M9H77_22251 [Catharanthus roseus]
MIFELEHTMNIYLSLFGSAERVYELIRRIQWRDGHAPPEHWLDTPDSLYLIANAFNLCVVLIAQIGSMIVLLMYSYSDRTTGILVIGHLAEQQHFIKLLA